MLFLVNMVVNVPHTMPKAEWEALVATEKAYAQELQRTGQWAQLWRVVGQYANYSIFDVPGNDELHELLASLPLFPYMTITVTPLAEHPSRI
jgi:muconolactone D-isomerase